MDAIESDNPSLKGVLPKVYARGNLDPVNLGSLIDEFSNVDLGHTKSRSADILGHVFEYFLGEFALAEGKKGGQFYTPRSVVQLLVEMLQPYKGRVFDPCCGSGGMFVQSEKFVEEHQGKINDRIQHFIYHLHPTHGHAGFVMAKGALTSKSSGEGDIRRALVEARLLDCVVNLPPKLFLNTQIPASLWFMRRGKSHHRDDVLFIDMRNMGHLINRRTLELSDDDMQKVAALYQEWRSEDSEYEDVQGFCKSVSIDDIAEKDYVLTPGRYVGLEETEDDFVFEERFTELQAELEEQIKQEAILNERILENLAKVQVGG